MKYRRQISKYGVEHSPSSSQERPLKFFYRQGQNMSYQLKPWQLEHIWCREENFEESKWDCEWECGWYGIECKF